MSGGGRTKVLFVRVPAIGGGSYGGRDMNATEDVWAKAVAEAAARQDTDELADLFAQARETWGSQEASRMWLAALSAFDASAVTG